MRYLRYATVFLVGVALQWVWSTYWPLWGAAPQLLLVLTVALSSREGPVLAVSLAFVWGLFSDVMRVRLFGADALLFACVARGIGLARRQIDVSSWAPQAALLGAISYFYFPARALLGLIFDGRAFWAGWREFLLTPIFNCLVAPAAYVFIEQFTRKHES